MDAFELAQIQPSVYQHQCFVLATKHFKSIALAPVFSQRLGARIQELHVDTDQLGSFCGEVPRQLSPVQAAREKCLLALQHCDADFAIGSEGSFAPHPDMPFINANQEILYLIDRRHGIELYVSSISSDIHHYSEVISDMDELFRFAEQTRFPTYGLMLTAHPKQEGNNVFKGITSFANLRKYFLQAQALSPHHQVHVESELRAHLNPKRMKHIAQVGHQLVDRLLRVCPQCQSPGWGKSQILAGLPCQDCGQATHAAAWEIWRCVKCDYSQKQQCNPTAFANPAHCPSCNP